MCVALTGSHRYWGCPIAHAREFLTSLRTLKVVFTQLDPSYLSCKQALVRYLQRSLRPAGAAPLPPLSPEKVLAEFEARSQKLDPFRLNLSGRSSSPASRKRSRPARPSERCAPTAASPLRSKRWSCVSAR